MSFISSFLFFVVLGAFLLFSVCLCDLYGTVKVEALENDKEINEKTTASTFASDCGSFGLSPLSPTGTTAPAHPLKQSATQRTEEKVAQEAEAERQASLLPGIEPGDKDVEPDDDIWNMEI